MSKKIDITIPDIGDFDNVPVIEVLVAKGDQVEKDQSLLTLESEKATMEIPSPEAGTILSLTISEGDNVAKGAVIGQMEVSEEKNNEDDKNDSSQNKKPADKQAKPAKETQQETKKKTEQAVSLDHDYDTDLVVIGAGPGGYTAAFRAADLGLNVTLVERHETLGEIGRAHV